MILASFISRTWLRKDMNMLLEVPKVKQLEMKNEK